MAQAASIVKVDRTNFQTEVIQRSYELPVVVDFWAPWCAPCRMLAPILDRLAQRYAGRLVIAKLNTDENPELSMEYGIRGIPAVKIFRSGRVAAEFVGVRPERDVEAILRPFLAGPEAKLAEEGLELLSRGHVQAARERFEKVLADDPVNPKALVGLARVALHEGDLDAAERYLSRVPRDGAQGVDVEQELASIRLARAARELPSVDEARRRLQSNGLDAVARMALAVHEALDGAPDRAMNHLLEVIRMGGDTQDKARELLLQIFAMVGPDDPRVRTARARLATLLY